MQMNGVNNSSIPLKYIKGCDEFSNSSIFFRNCMLLFCVKPWNKPFVYQTCIAINSCAFLIMEMFTRINVHGFGK
jgi:hypothetical protein